MSRARRRILIVMIAALPGGCGGGGAPPPRRAPEPSVASAAPVEAPGLHNVFRLTDRLYSGSSPDGEEGFRSLQNLGVRTVLSVDGARPEVELARRYGMRYVHLPIGYDGVPRDQALRLARAVRDLPGPVYLHCHHGKHRGPAAAAVVRLFLDPACGVETVFADMRRAGTDPHYVGLYAAPAALPRPAPGELDGIPAEFREATPAAALVELMVALDERWDLLKQVRAAGWKVPPDHPDLDPPHEALQLVEHCREAARLPATAKRPDEFRRWLAEAEAAARELEDVLRAGKAQGAVDGPAADRALKRAGDACVRCHTAYRDRPR
jgi:protein tyrosine phosphatase (PTP) superfamily phosphohydrolase (DUF442 family)